MVAARIFGILAPEANQVVLLRRGPSKKTLQLVWDLGTDKISSGQWIKGRVYEQRCDVSPDGRFFVGAFTNYSADDYKKQGWTAISRPPYFTALALWFTGCAWNGGGIFQSSTKVRLNNCPMQWIEDKAVRKPLRASLLNLGLSEHEPIYSMLLKKRGWNERTGLKTKLLNPNWREVGESVMELLSDMSRWSKVAFESFEQMIPKYEVTREGVWERSFTNGMFRRIDRYHTEVWQLLDSDEKVMREWSVKQSSSFWLEYVDDSDVIFAENGCLIRWKRFPNGKPKIIADLNDLKFESVAPPDWALMW